MRCSLTTEVGSCRDTNARVGGYCSFCVVLAPRGALTICQVPFLPGGEVLLWSRRGVLEHLGVGIFLFQGWAASMQDVGGQEQSSSAWLMGIY